jgi:hypothetical protein
MKKQIIADKRPLCQKIINNLKINILIFEILTFILILWYQTAWSLVEQERGRLEGYLPLS